LIGTPHGMTEFSDKTVEGRGAWTLSKDALQRLLNSLDGGANSDGRAYVEMRRRLRDYFGRKQCRTADDLADETLTRVEEGIARDETPARYCYIVARVVFLEHLRETKAHRMVTHVSGDVAPRPSALPAADFPDAERLVKRLVVQELFVSFVPAAGCRPWRTAKPIRPSWRHSRLRADVPRPSSGATPSRRVQRCIRCTVGC
jgi:hypothetical protein